MLEKLIRYMRQSDKSQFGVGLGYSQQAKLSLSVTDENERVLWKGYPFPMLAMELFAKERQGKVNLNE